jgi:hypothetical protein
MHIALKGSTTPEDIWLAFEPTEFHESGLHFKAQEAFLLHDKSEIGIETIGNPDRTDALKRWLGLVAWSILQSAPEMTVAQGGGLESFIHGPKEG